VPAPPIVVGIDGSPSALDAVRWATAEAVSRHVALHIVSAALLTPDSFVHSIDRRAIVFGARENETRHALATAMDHALRCAAPAPLSARTEFVYGPAAAALTERSASALMVVVGSRGHGGFTSALAGSLGTTVAIRWAFDEAARRDTDIVAVHAWSDADLATVSALLEAYPSPLDTRVDEEAAMAESLAGFQEDYPNVRVRRVVVRDNPARELVRAAHGARMIVTGTRGRGGFGALLLGSTSRAVIHRAHLPVVTVPSSSTTAI